ncbi:hypothetical protein HYC85_006042 [Camellia sinensis]|uniref:J domain-containing protein n=1 Tax=Camellia sinensis TaxID=4442 RepID=A0A7J7I2E1_CAMSI|nr:hypothetical protein HYC85_006042 [Camellia sinensis]
MAFLTGRSSSLVDLYHHHRPIFSITRQSNLNTTAASRWWWFSTTGTESIPSELAGKNAYDLLGVSETSSFAEIKASFRRLAKETHPDLTQSLDHSSDSHRFVQILAAYELCFDVLNLSLFLEKLFTIANYAYYGESMDLLPDCFEADERSACETPEVLHLVSGRDLFGMISLADKVPELSQSYNEKLSSFASRGSGLCQAIENISRQTNSGSDDIGIHRMQATEIDYHASDAYKDLELHASGKVVALATRVPPKSYCNGIRNADS